jgi:hypothetical protein
MVMATLLLRKPLMRRSKLSPAGGKFQDCRRKVALPGDAGVAVAAGQENQSRLGLAGQ